LGTRNDAKEIAKLSALADNEQATPLVQIAAARKLLRFTEFSARSCRVAKRVANRWLAAEEVSQSIRNRAALLLNFTLERKIDTSEEPDEAGEATASGSSKTPDTSLPLPGPKFWLPLCYDEDYITEDVAQKLLTDAIAGYDQNEPAFRYNEKGVLVQTEYFVEQRRKLHQAYKDARPPVYHLWRAFLNYPSNENRAAFKEAKQKFYAEQKSPQLAAMEI
jgi:hypothetical protein